jgi:hypothetical protein
MIHVLASLSTLPSRKYAVITTPRPVVRLAPLTSAVTQCGYPSETRKSQLHTPLDPVRMTFSCGHGRRLPAPPRKSLVVDPA